MPKESFKITNANLQNYNLENVGFFDFFSPLKKTGGGGIILGAEYK